MTQDPFGSAETRERVLASWASSPVRFREDANAEEELALGGYRDRVVVELAQNAADAAARAGVPGRLLLALRELDGGAVLVAANTGAPLDAAGVQALATLRASAKRDEQASVGRFGVGFAAVLAVTDSPAVVSRSGGVRFSAPDTRALVEEAARTSPGLAEELARRDGHVPALRLPFEAEGTPPDGYDTAVLLPLRDATAEDLLLRLLAEVGDPLLLALPGLAEVSVDVPGAAPRAVSAVADRWHVLRRSGRLDAALLADRPTEERARTGWQVTWALPRGSGVRPPGVLHAPTPSDEPLPWPALLVASFPLDSARRHVAPGPATDALAGHAAGAYADLLAERAAAGEDVLPLVPTGLPAGVLDGALRAEVLARLPGMRLLPAAEDPSLLLRPRDAVALDPPAGADLAAVAALASWLPSLVPAPRSASAAMAVLGVRRMPLADLVEALPPVADPRRWRELYAALEPLAVEPAVAEALAALPVPLADGRVVRGARGLVLLTQTAGDVGLLGVRAVHPDAAHRLLERLGAVIAGPRGVLELPALRAAVQDSPESEHPEELADAVLAFVALAVAAVELEPGDLPWLADLALTDAEGEPAPAGALALPGSVAAELFDPGEIGLVAGDVLERWGAEVLAATGVLTGPALLHADDVPLDPLLPAGDDGADPSELDGWSEWMSEGLAAVSAATTGPIPVVPEVAELVAVRDLDAVRAEALPDLVRALAGDPRLRTAVVSPARIVAGPVSLDVPPYTAWWLRRRMAAAGGPLLDPDAEPALRGLFEPAPGWLAGVDAPIRRALGAVARVDDLDADGVTALVQRLADPALELTVPDLLQLWRRLAELAAAGAQADPPAQVRAVARDKTRVVAADEAVVVDAPMYLQRPDLGAPVVPPPALADSLADLLDLPLAGDLAAGVVAEPTAESGAGSTPVPEAVQAVLPAAPETWCEHDRLVVDGVEVEWWVTPPADGEEGPDATAPGGVVHASTLAGLAAGLAWAAGAWHRRLHVAQVLLDPAAATTLLVEDALDEAGPGRGPSPYAEPRRRTYQSP